MELVYIMLNLISQTQKGEYNVCPSDVKIRTKERKRWGLERWFHD